MNNVDLARRLMTCASESEAGRNFADTPQACREAAGVLDPCAGMPIDPSTGRPNGDHGTANDAIEFALETVDGPGEGEDFLRAWREGDLDEWPEFYPWLAKREAGR